MTMPTIDCTCEDNPQDERHLSVNDTCPIHGRVRTTPTIEEMTPETLYHVAADLDRLDSPRDAKTVRLCISQWYSDLRRANLVDDAVGEYRELLRAMKRRDPNLDEVWMEQYATEKLAALPPAPEVNDE